MSYASNLLKELQNRGITIENNAGGASSPATSEPARLPETTYANRLINILNTRSYISANSGADSFLRDADDFFRTSQRETSGSNFNAADFFEERRKQAENLKTRASNISKFIDGYDDAYLPQNMRGIKDYLSGFNTQVDDVLGYYQRSANAKTGMRAYEDEMLVAMDRNQKIAQAMGAPWNMPEITNPVYGFINMQNQYRADNTYREVNDQWTDEQKYNLGLLQQQDPKQAEQYAIRVNNDIKAKQNEAQRQGIRDAAVQNKGLHTIGALGTSTFLGMPEFLERVAEHTVRGTTTEKSGLMPTDYSSEVVGGITENLNQQYGTINEGIPVLGGKGVGDLYNMGYNIGQNLLNRYTLGAVGGQPLVMASYFANAATSAVDNARRRGATGDQAMALGLITGAAEVATEYLPVSELFKMGPAVSIRDLLKTVGIQSLEELVGEYANSRIGWYADKVIMADMSSYETAKQHNIEQGMTPEEAETAAWRSAWYDSLYEGLSGAVSGLVSGSGETAYKTGMANQYYRQNVDPQSLIDEAMGTSAESKAYQMAQELQTRVDAGENISGNSKRMLAYNTELQQTAEAKIAAENAAAEDLAALGETGNIQELAAIVAKRTMGEKLSHSETRTLKRSDNAQHLLEAMKEPETSTGEEPGVVSIFDPVKVSDTGRSIQISTNQNVDALDFASIAKGKATIQLKDGSIANYSDISFGTEEEGNRFRVVANLPGIETEAANDLFHTLEDNHAGEDIDSMVAVRDAYLLGYRGAQESDLNEKGREAAYLAPELRKAVYDIGVAQRRADALAKPANRAVQTKASEGYKKVVFEGKPKNLTKKQNAELAFVDYIADNFSGTAVHVFSSYKGRDGKFYYRDSNGERHRAPNGKYVKDEIWIDLNSGDRGEGLMLNTFAHEMYHHVEKWNKAEAQRLAEFVVKELGLESVDKAVALQIKKARKAGLGESYFVSEGMTQEQATNEVYMRAVSDFVADSLETMFTRGDPATAISNLRSENQGLFEEIKQFVDKWVSKLKKFYAGRTVSEEGEMVAQLKSFEQIQKLFMEAMQGAGENYRAAEEPLDQNGVEPVDLSGDEMLSVKAEGEEQAKEYSYEGLSADAFYKDGAIYRYDFLVAQNDMKITDKLPDIKDLQTNGKVDTEKVVSAGFNNVMEVGGKKTGSTYQITNAYTGRTLQIGKTSITHGLGNNINSLRTNARLGAVIGELCKNAILLNGIPNTHNVRGTYVMATLVNTKVNNKDMNMVALITVEQQNGKVQSVDFVDVAHAVSGRLVRDIENENRSAQGTPPGTKSEWVTRFSTIKISDFLDIVNRTHQGYLSDDVISALNVERRGDKKGLFSLRNEEVDNSVRGILSRIDVNSRKLDAEKYHLGLYQERVKKLAEQEARLKDANAKIEELSSDKVKNKAAIRELQSEARNAQLQINMYNRQLKQAEQSDLIKRLVAEQRLKEYRAEQREAEQARIQEYRALRKELTGVESVMDVMEDEFVRLAKDYEAQKIDLKTMEAEFVRLAKEYEKQGKTGAKTVAKVKQLKSDTRTWEREFKRLMDQYESMETEHTDAKSKIAALEADIEHRKQRAKEKVQSRQRTEIRNKIQKQADSLNKLLLKPDKKKHILEPLQGSVAAILEAINMRRSDHYIDTLMRYDQRIATEPDPVIRGELMREREAFEEKGDSFAGKMLALKEAYKNIRDNADPEAQGLYDEVLSEYLDEMVRKVGDTPLGKMTKDQLELVHDTLTAVQTVVSNANKAFDDARKQGITDMSQQAIGEIRNIGGHRKESGETAEEFRKFGWNNMKPIYALETIGSKILNGLFGNVRNGEDVWARNISEAKGFFKRVSEKHGLKDWDLEKEFGFTSSSGLDFKLNVEQIMSIYAYAKRNQARDHLRKGGIVIDPNSTKTVRNKLGLKTKLIPTDATAYNIDDVTLGEIIDKLSAEQKNFVDEMQGYLSDTMGAKGNEVSLKLYGIKLFKEKNYFPLRSSGAYNARAEAQKDGDVKLKNAGFTKAVTPNASNPIVLTPFLSTWAGHVDEMSMYNAFTLPLEDFYRVLNYHTANVEGNASQSVRAAIQNAYGKAAVDYLDQLLKDLNGGARSDNAAGFVNKALSLYKKGATMASFSVVIQQPSAVVRAAAMIPHKYFIGPKVTEQSHNKTWAEMKQYAPICHIKEMGYFDTSVGKSTKDYLTGTEYEGFREKAKAVLTDSDFRDEALGKLPALADEFGWAMIWNAVKREQYDLHSDMKATDPKFLNMVADRFTDVIVHTQVYDSVLSRSAHMRNKKDNLMKMATAFMAEPTTNINMISNAILQGKRSGNWVQARRTIGAVVGSQILNAMLVSIVYAARDDEEDKRLDEKYISSLTENLVSSFNPMTYIPYLRDLNSQFRGYNVERADMAVTGDLVQAWNTLWDEDKTPWEKVETFTGAVFQAFGLPVKNIMRDVKAVWNTVNSFANAEKHTATGYAVAVKEAMPFAKRLSNGEEMLIAIRSGDEAHIQRVFGRFENQQKAGSALQSAIREEYLAGKITAEEATQLLTDNFDREDESEVYWILDGWNYAKENDSSEGYTKMGSLMNAVDSGENLDTEIQRYLDNGMEASDIKSQISKVYRKRYLEADEETRAGISDKARAAYLQLDDQDADVDARIKEWDFEAEYGMTYSDMKSEYREGEVTESVLREAMRFHGMKNFEIEETIRGLNEDITFRERFGMSLSELKDSYDDGDVTRNTLISALEFTGKTRTQAQEEVNQRDIGNRLGIDYMNLDDAYKHGDISRQTFYNAMIENGATRQEADEAIQGYDWLKKNVKKYPNLAISDAKKFAVSLGSNAEGYTLEDFGVSIEAYQEYKIRKPECKGVDANGDGKTDSGTLRDSAFQMIDSLPISDEAKDGLALMSYSMSSIRKNAPWH